MCAGALAVALTPATSLAADSIYWSIYRSLQPEPPGKIRIGDFNGGGRKDVSIGEAAPEDIAIDAAAGKLYWAATDANTIRVANLDGTGARALFTNEPRVTGLAIDARARKLYWTNYTTGAIRVGNLDGTGATNVATGEDHPSGIALDPVGGKLYWGLYDGGAVRVLSLAGGGPQNLFITEPYVTGVAVDPAAGHIYWTNEFAGLIRVGNLNGTGPRTLYKDLGWVGGLALDPEAGKIYWASYTLNSINVGNLDQSGMPRAIHTNEGQAFYLALLRTPGAAGAPRVTGGNTVGQALTCNPAAWAGDFPAGHLSRAPQSIAYQWLKDGVPIGGATATVYTAFVPGTYSCRVTATNFAGSTSQTSEGHAVAAASAAPPPPPGGGPVAPGAALKKLKAGYAIFFAYNRLTKRNAPTRFSFSQIPSGGSIEVRCHGKGCKLKRKRGKVKGSRANLLALVRTSRLARGAYLEVRTSAPGYITEVLRFIAAGSTGAKLKRQCLPPGAKRPQKC